MTQLGRIGYHQQITYAPLIYALSEVVATNENRRTVSSRGDDEPSVPATALPTAR